MDEESPARLEDALARTDADAEATLRAANATIRALKRFRAAAHDGDLRELPRSLEAAAGALEALQRQFEEARAGWSFDEEAYLAGGEYTRELLEAARAAGVRVFEEGDRLFSYPHLVRLLPAERAVLIDKTRERRLRPSVLAAQLHDRQNRPVRFRPEAFLESLRAAYDTAVRARGAEPGAVVPLVEIYELLTLLPGQSREYTLPEFARDIYLLDGSGVTTTRESKSRPAAAVSFPASSGTRAAARTLTVITQEGREKKYYGISFTPA